MSWEYSCPKCEAMLNPGSAIILTASHKKTRILIGMHPQPGKYEIFLPPNVSCEDGSKWDFSCPLCQEDLKTKDDGNLCELGLLVDGESMRIIFSRIAGEHATFILHEDVVKEKHGEDVDRYDPFQELKNYARF